MFIHLNEKVGIKVNTKVGETNLVGMERTYRISDTREPESEFSGSVPQGPG